MYKIKIYLNGGKVRFLEWCDDHWYKTSDIPLKTYSKEDVVKICGQLKKHYVYTFDVLDENGDVILHESNFKNSKSNHKTIGYGLPRNN